jgi:type VI secretion system secreted protein Hcp
MHRRMTMHSAILRVTRAMAIPIALTLLGVLIGSLVLGRADAASPTAEEQEPLFRAAIGDLETGDAVYAKYDGIDGESIDVDHNKWIDVLSIDWGVHKPGGGVTGQSRRRGDAVVDDFVLEFYYEKSAPKLLEKCLMGAVIPKLEVELTMMFGGGDTLGSEKTFLRYEFKNVVVTGYDVATDPEVGYPRVTVANNFEEMKVTYTEYDDEGNSKGNVEVTWKIEPGEE